MIHTAELKQKTPILFKDYRDDVFRFHFEVLSKGLRSFLIFLLSSARCLRFIVYSLSTIKMKEYKRGSHILVVGTKNNLDAMQFLIKGLENVAIVALNSEMATKMKGAVTIPMYIDLKIIIEFITTYLYFIAKYKLRAFAQPDVVLKTISAWHVTKRWAYLLEAKSIIFSNDHSPPNRAIAYRAKLEGVKTIYLQHASVGNDFPKLIFNLSLLEGEDALSKYRKAGIEGNITLIGMPKADSFISKRKETNRTLRTIGIGISKVDDTKNIKDLINYLRKNYSYKLIFRQHPRDKRTFSFSAEIEISNSRVESSFDFLNRIDVLIAGVTSMHLEATMLNIPCIYYDLNGFYRDYYGYAQNGLCYNADSLQTVSSFISDFHDKLPNVVDKAKYYNATIGTEMEGRSEELAIKAINDFFVKVHAD